MQVVGGVSTAASSVVGFSAGQGSAFASGTGLNLGKARLNQVQLSGGSSIATTAGFILNYGNTTADNSLVLCAGGSSVLDWISGNLNLEANVFEVVAPTTNANGTVGLLYLN